MAISKQERAAALVSQQPWLELDWSNNGPYGRAEQLRDPRPCIICKEPAWLLSPRKMVPTHHECASHFHLVRTLCSILAGLGDVEESVLMPAPLKNGYHLASLLCSILRKLGAVQDEIPDWIATPRYCRSCGNRLLLISPGRDICARHGEH